MTTLDPRLGTRNDAGQSLSALLPKSRAVNTGGQPASPESFDALLRQQLDRRPYAERSRSADTNSSRPEPSPRRDRADRPIADHERTPLNDRRAPDSVRSPQENTNDSNASDGLERRSVESTGRPAAPNRAAVDERSTLDTDAERGQSASAPDTTAGGEEPTGLSATDAEPEATSETDNETNGENATESRVPAGAIVLVDLAVAGNLAATRINTEPDEGASDPLAVVEADDGPAIDLEAPETLFPGPTADPSVDVAARGEVVDTAELVAETVDFDASFDLVATAKTAKTTTGDSTIVDVGGPARLSDDSASSDESGIDSASVTNALVTEAKAEPADSGGLAEDSDSHGSDATDTTPDSAEDAASETVPETTEANSPASTDGADATDTTPDSVEDAASETVPETTEADSPASTDGANDAAEATIDTDTGPHVEASKAARAAMAESDGPSDASDGEVVILETGAEPVPVRSDDSATVSSTRTPTTDAGDASIRSDGASAAPAAHRSDANSTTTAATAAATARTMSFDGDVAEQVRQAVNLVRQSGPGRHEVALLLRPDDLGSVTVELIQNGDEVSVRIVTQTTAAQERLDRGRLLADLQSAGLDPASVDIDHRDPSDADAGTDGNDRGNGRFGTSPSGNGSDDNGPAPIQRRSVAGTQAGAVDLAL